MNGPTTNPLISKAAWLFRGRPRQVRTVGIRLPQLRCTEVAMIKRLGPLLILLACGEGTGPGGSPTFVFMSKSSDTVPNEFDVYVMNSDGTHVVNLTQHVAINYEPAWSSDGSKIIFSSAGRDTTGRWHLYVMNVDGSQLSRLTFTSRSEMQPAWSPDGGKIALISNNDLYVMNADVSAITPLVAGSGIEADPSWSPDGRIVFFSTRAASSRISGHLFVISADGTGLTSLGDSTTEDGSPAWSPDGTKIAFSSRRETTHSQVWIMNPDGSAPLRLTNDSTGAGGPSWSHDGTKIVFTSNRDGNVEIYEMNADGSNQTRLTYRPTWIDIRPRWPP